MVGQLQTSCRGSCKGGFEGIPRFILLCLTAFQRTKAGELVITPKQSEAEWYRWLETIQDWCISRQLWWGHRCPAYFVRIDGKDQDVRGSAWFNFHTFETSILFRPMTEKTGLWGVI